MKQFITLFLLISLYGQSKGQVSISSGVSWVTTGNATVVLQDLSLVNNGAFYAGAGSFKFTGSANSTISGTALPSFNIIEVAKTSGAKILLNRNIIVNSSINFFTGLLDLNNNNIQLNSSASLNGESETSRIIGPSGGEVSISLGMNKPNSVNAGNLGAILSSSSQLSTVTIKRGHKEQTGSGMTESISRYFNITTGGNGNQISTLRFKYFDAELNALNENNLDLFRSTNTGSSWSNQGYTTRNTTENWLEKTGLSPLQLLTLSIDNTPPPSVTGLVFNASRSSSTLVQLNWTTATENNLQGFEVQRRLDNETDFTARTFINSYATGGNSNNLLSYAYSDINSHTGTSYYRLKIVDLNNNFTYSEIKSVGKMKGKGGGNGGNNLSQGNPDNQLVDAENGNPVRKITIGPNPNNGNFWFTVNGLEKETAASLYTIDGKLIRQFNVQNLQQQKVNGLSNGIYILKVPGMDVYKVLVRGSNYTATNNVIQQPEVIKN